MDSIEYRFVTFSVILNGEGFFPLPGITAKQHATFATGRNYLVLAERKRGEVPEAAYAPPADGRSMCLRAVLDQDETVLVSQF